MSHERTIVVTVPDIDHISTALSGTSTYDSLREPNEVRKHVDILSL